MLKGHIREIKQDIERLEQGVYLTIWVPIPHNTFAEKETDEEVQEKVKMFKNIHPGEIEFKYTDDERK